MKCTTLALVLQQNSPSSSLGSSIDAVLSSLQLYPCTEWSAYMHNAGSLMGLRNGQWPMDSLLATNVTGIWSRMVYLASSRIDALICYIHRSLTRSGSQLAMQRIASYLCLLLISNLNTFWVAAILAFLYTTYMQTSTNVVYTANVYVRYIQLYYPNEMSTSILLFWQATLIPVFLRQKIPCYNDWLYNKSQMGSLSLTYHALGIIPANILRLTQEFIT